MQEIRSESCGRAAVPPPRPWTLEEFLNRKKGAPESVTRLKMEQRVLTEKDGRVLSESEEGGEGNNEKTGRRKVARWRRRVKLAMMSRL